MRSSKGGAGELHQGSAKAQLVTLNPFTYFLKPDPILESISDTFLATE